MLMQWNVYLKALNPLQIIPIHSSSCLHSDHESPNPSQSSGTTALIISISTWYYFVTAFFYLLQLCSSQGGVQRSKYVWYVLSNWNKLILTSYSITDSIGSFCRKVRNGMFILARGSILQVLECILTKITVRLHEHTLKIHRTAHQKSHYYCSLIGIGKKINM